MNHSLKLKNSACILGTIGLVTLFHQTEAFAITITGISDYSTTPIENLFLNVGDYSAVSGEDPGSSQDQIFEVLPIPNRNPTATQTSSMGDLFDTLSSGGITSATSLVFGFGINQSGANNLITIEALDMVFTLPDGSTSSFSLGTETITLDNVAQNGASAAEVRIELDLGFDFMTTYTSSSTEDFTITATLSNQNAGSESFFLSSGYTERGIPVPFEFSPGLGIISLVGLFGLRQWSKRKKLSDDSQK